MPDTITIVLINNREDLAPTKSYEYDAAHDCKAAITKKRTLRARQRVIIPLGFKLIMPRNVEAQIRPRSGLAAKHGITIMNSPGTIDSGYEGEVKAIVYNASDEPFHITPKMRICQMLFKEVPAFTISIRKEQSMTTLTPKDSQRGESGFGSTGTQ